VHIDHTDCPEDCQTCEYDHERTGPYRLIDGTWSDGVDRTERIDVRTCSGRYEVTAGKHYSHVWHGAHPAEEFDTWAEAIAYADRMARTTTKEENK